MTNNGWHSVTVRCLSAEEEIVSALLIELGSSGVSITEHGESCEVTGYFPDDLPVNNIVSDFQNAYPSALVIDTDHHNQNDWVASWKQFYQPTRISRHLTIVPSWDSEYIAGPGELLIRLDPDISFGTGTHPTTVLALYALEQTLRDGETVIDVGTGSGVLAIASSRLGASKVLATDLDDKAVAIARANISLNDSNAKINVIVNDSLKDVTEQAEVIVANILAEVLVNLIDDAVQLLNPSGHLILSGIYFDKIDLIRRKVQEAGLNIVTSMSQGEWHCLVVTR